ADLPLRGIAVRDVHAPDIPLQVAGIYGIGRAGDVAVAVDHGDARQAVGQGRVACGGDGRAQVYLGNDRAFLRVERIQNRLLLRAVVAVAEEHEPAGARIGERRGTVGQTHVRVRELPQNVRGKLSLGGDPVGTCDVESEHTVPARALGAGQHRMPARVARKLHVRRLRGAVHEKEVARVVIGVRKIDEVVEYPVWDVCEALLAGCRIEACSIPSLAPI